ncbi:heparan-alpha-glucosaminide N-acetyltransferase [uncultured Endozoicomonas sp.]|uniref:heparan-alpha-glucosaminide N-acetyltransferase n=1 Tax=uncultured Endozoicomonas sp. TaxID=432652 RepID=UPI002631BFED|nr:heparan-alpha-glucosaminide N-acetyltransferase [uncultured Endozoicomonas sp.]
MFSTSIVNHSNRYPIIDWLRGIAIILMVVFHFVYDLRAFDLIAFDTKALWWRLYNNLIIFLFLFCAGLGLYVCHRQGIRWEVVRRQVMKLGAAALSISVITWYLFPNSWIYFGTLHCILASYLLGLLFVKKPLLALMVAAVNYLSLLYTYEASIEFPRFGEQGSLDHIPLYPFGAALFLGVFAASIGFHRLSLPIKSGSNLIPFLGRHSLKIYLGHQVILYPLVMAYANWVFSLLQ